MSKKIIGREYISPMCDTLETQGYQALCMSGEWDEVNLTEVFTVEEKDEYEL